jgi:hypothetical protein
MNCSGINANNWKLVYYTDYNMYFAQN